MKISHTRPILAKTKVVAGLVSLFAIPLASAASSAGSGEIAIYTTAGVADGPAVTTAANNDTTNAITHDYAVANVREDAGSFTRAGTDITLNRDGHYLAIYNSQFNSTGGANRSELQSFLELAGTPVANSWSQGYIRRTSNQDKAVCSGAAVFNATNGDVLKLRSFRTDNNGTGTVTRAGGQTALQLIKLDDTDMAYTQLGFSAAPPVLTADFQDLPYDNEIELAASEFSNTAGALTLTNGGKYIVVANTYAAGGYNRNTMAQQLTLDGSEIIGSKTVVFLRGTLQNSCGDGAAAVGTIIEAAAGQVLRVQVKAGKVDPTTQPVIDGTRSVVSVIKLPAGGDYIRADQSTDQNVSAATERVLTYSNQVELDSSFSHTAGTASPANGTVTVNTSGDYLFFGSVFENDGDGTRTHYHQGWQVNGSAREIYGQTGRYHRNANDGSGYGLDYGNFSGFIGNNLAATDTVEMVSIRLGENADDNANRVALQGVRLDSLFKVSASPNRFEIAEGGATGTYDISLGLSPTSGTVDITVTADADTELSATGGAPFSSSLVLSFAAGGVPQTVTVQAIDDSDLEGDEVGTVTHAITLTGDATNYPLGTPIPDVNVTIVDNDVPPVVANDDASLSNLSEDATATEALTGNLLANDTDGLNNFVSAFDAYSSFGAVVNVQPDGTFTYDPTGAPGAQSLANGATEVDTFTYTAQDSAGNTDTATVSITLDGSNDGPEAQPNVLNDGPLETDSSYVSTVDITLNDGSYRLNTPLSFPAGSDLRLVPGKVVTQTPSVGTPPGNGFPENAFDGDVNTFTHTQANNNTVDHVWQVEFEQDVSLENVTLFNRTGNQDRFRDITVTVLDGGGTEIFDSGLLNPTTNPVTIVQSLFVDFAGPITGRTLVVTRTPDLTDANAGNGSILSLGEVTIIGSAPGATLEINDLLLSYDAAQSAGTGRWENLGSGAGTVMDWVLTDVDLVSVTSARTGITSAYEWDNINDATQLASGVSGSVHDNVAGDPDNQDATWEFWVKPANTSSIMTLFETGGATGFGCIINNGVLEAATELDGSTMDGSYVSYDLVADPEGLVGGDPTTEFNQYAVTITINGGLQLYVNGVLVDETTTGVSGDWDGGDGAGLGRFGETNHGGFANGASGGTYDAPFFGQMAIVRLYSGALSHARIYQNYNAVNTSTDIEGEAITAIGVIDGTDTFVANGSPATLASGALVTMTNATGGFDYNPNGVFNLAGGVTATDTFTYRVEDSSGLTAESTVRVTIYGVTLADDDNLLAKEGQNRVFFANEIVSNDEPMAVAGNAYVDLSSGNIAGATWTNTGTSGAGRNGTGVSPVSAPNLESNFGALGQAATVGGLLDLDPISTADATLEVWFKPEAGQSGKKTIFETGGNGIGFSLVFDPLTNEVIATIDGGDDATQAVVAIAGGVATADFNQVIVVYDRDGGDEVGDSTNVFEDILTVYLNNDPTTPFDDTADATIVDPEGDANDWSGTDDCGINRVNGTSARNENFTGMAGEVAIIRAYARILTPAEMEMNYNAAVQAITSVTSPTTDQSATATLNADGSVTVDYTGISLAVGDSIVDSFDYTINDNNASSSSATVSIVIEANTTQEDWRLTYYGDISNSGPGADNALGANGLPNIQSFAFDLDPTDASPGTLEVDTGAGTILTLGPPLIWLDTASDRFYLRHTRRADYASIPLTITDQFSRNLSGFEDSAVAPTVIATGTGASGAAIEAVQTELPVILPVSGGKARFGRVNVSN